MSKAQCWLKITFCLWALIRWMLVPLTPAGGSLGHLLEGAWMGILLGGCGCQASPLLLSLSVVGGGRRGASASCRCCRLLLMGRLGKDIRPHNRNFRQNRDLGEREVKEASMVLVGEESDEVS